MVSRPAVRPPAGADETSDREPPMSVADSASGDGDPVRELYRRYPYPTIAAIEAAGHDFAPLGALDYVRHVFWPGRRSLAGLRVLDAGCGTGMTSVQIARDYPEVEVTALDISDTSLGLARELAARRGVGANLTFRLGRIEDLPPASLVPDTTGEARGYDYIVSSGVLHHLADPIVGAQRLAALLAPQGGMAVMLYATHGRHAVYLMQDLLRRLGGDAPMPEQVRLARRVVEALPSCHPFADTKFPDHTWEGDAGLVDLLLHPRDRSYTVADVLSLIDAAGLRLERFLGHVRYQPELYLRDDETRARVARLADPERHAVAELLHGAMGQHTFFATRPSYRPVRLPVQGLALLAQRGARSPLMLWPDWLPAGRAVPGTPVARRPTGAPGRQITVEDLHIDPLVRTFDLDGWNLDVVAAFDGQHTAAQVFERPDIQAAIPGPDQSSKLQAFGSFLQELAEHELLLFEP